MADGIPRGGTPNRVEGGCGPMEKGLTAPGAREAHTVLM